LLTITGLNESIRTPASFNSQLSLSKSLGIPLLTLWSTAWCPSCRTIEPLLRDLISSGVGEQEGGVLFAPVQFDTPEMMSTPIPLASRYSITSTPTLLSFDAGEPVTSTKVMDARKLADRQFLIDWIRNEAKRHDSGGGGGGAASFGGLFNSK
jgi:thiol-disulfide isomerase/thioredoxin